MSSGELVRDETGWRVDRDVSTAFPIRSRDRSGASDVARARAGNVIVAAAMLGRQFDWALLPGVAGVGEPEALEALKRAREVQLIEPVPADAGSFRFRHSLTRDAILADLTPPDVSGPPPRPRRPSCRLIPACRGPGARPWPSYTRWPSSRSPPFACS